MAKSKRKPSAYNLHVKREMKAGKSMKQAARSWNGGGSAGRKSTRRATVRRAPTRRTHRRTTQMAKKKRSYRRYGTAIKPTDMIMGSVAYGFMEPTLDGLAARVGVGIPDEFLKAGLGYYAAKKSKNKIVKAAGLSALAISSYKLARFGIGAGAGTSSVALRATIN